MRNQAFNALLFLYQQVLNMPHVFGDIDALRAKRPQRLPTVLSFDETMAVIDALTGVFQLIVKLIYGCGLRGIECVRLRVKDVDFVSGAVTIEHLKVRLNLSCPNCHTRLGRSHTPLPFEVKVMNKENLGQFGQTLWSNRSNSQSNSIMVK